jgi:hypothetical protein
LLLRPSGRGQSVAPATWSRVLGGILTLLTVCAPRKAVAWEPVADAATAKAAVTVREHPTRLERAEPVVRRLLLVPETGRRTRSGEAAAHRLFNWSIALSGLRCLLGYVVLPVITPAIGAAARVGPVIGVPIALVALTFDVMAVRRFWAANHRWRWAITALYLVVMSLVLALLIGDLLKLA